MSTLTSVSLVALLVGFGLCAYGLWVLAQPNLACLPFPNGSGCPSQSDRLFAFYSLIFGLGVIILSVIGLAFSSRRPVIPPKEAVN